jgi:hypothetical protein
VAALALMAFAIAALMPSGARAACANLIACENALPGDPPSDWQVNGVGDSTIQGFATSMSVNAGGTESFKIKTPSAAYHIDILRLGYYGGDGARKITTITPSVSLPQTQPACLTNSSTGLIDCGNWSVSASWPVPSTAVSGVYIAHLVRDDPQDKGGESQIPFVVRNDASHSDILVSTSDATWEAYNDYGGNSLYTCTVACPPGNPLAYKAAYAVSYNRPWEGSFAVDNGESYLWYAEYQMIRFLEENGYDVSYTSSSDVDQPSTGSLLVNHKLFISSAHDEYWSAGQRANVTAALNAGVNLAFFSGNEIFWKTRWAASTADGSSTPDRTLITYKETHFNAPTDPQDPPTWTGAWADPRFSPPADGGLPANALSGQEFVVNAGTSDITVPSQYSALRLWRNTAIAALSPGQSVTLGAGIGTLGYEWDVDADNGFRPPGLFDVSSTTVSGVQPFTDYGSTTGTGTETHHLTLYRAPSGALVFGAGTVQWAWGLDNTNAWASNSTDPSGKPPDRNMQQATVNLFADMGVQPATPMSGLVAATASTDHTPPTSTITAPAAGSNLQDGAALTITGTATDSGGGVVAGVEVSTDGGSTWHPATIAGPDAAGVTWSYTTTAHVSPTETIESRAVDDSGNLETASDAESLNVACPCSIWGNVTPATPDAGDATAGEFAVQFKSDVFGTVSGIRFYKSALNTGTHVGSLWTASGQLLAQATFTNETASGWQTVTFSSPVAVMPNTTYVAGYYAPKGHYASTEYYFYPPPSPTPDGFAPVDSPPLHALRNTGTTVNGLYTYSSSPTFPTGSFQAENYWVDPIFSPSPPPGQATNASAVAGSSSAALSWSAPSSGGPVTSYVVTPYIGTAPQQTISVTGSPAPTSTTITGLANGSTYTFTVTATNPNGAATPSAASNAITPQAFLSAAFNGGFESSLSYWSAGGIVTPTASTAKPHSGSASAVLGTVSGTEPVGDSWVSQTVVVPSSATLSFWYWPSTTDDICSGSSCVYDWQEAQIRSTSGATLASVFKSNSNAKTWTQVSYNMSAYAGQTVVLWFNVHQDGGGDPTYMYLDDVSLAGSGPTPPGAPTNVVATAGNAQAALTWTAPSSNGGSAITSYTVTPFIGSTPQATQTFSGTSGNVTGLTNGTSYTFTVNATNAIGTGSASSPSNTVTPTAPTTPAFVQQVASHVSSATSLAVTPASNVTAGDREVVVVGIWSSGAATAKTVTDAAGNTYTELMHFTASENTEMSVWSAPISAGGGTKPTITVTPTARADIGVAALEYSGLSSAAGTGAVDQTAQASGTTTAAATVGSGATAATTASNELAVGFYVDSGFGDTLTAGSGFTRRSLVSNTPDMELLVEDQPAAQGATPAATVGTGSNTVWLMATVVFKHA